MSIKFSIILPFYNGKEFVKEAVDSVIKQSYTNWELIIVNDGSDQENTNFIEALVKTHNSEKISLFHKENEDVAIARNFAVKKSTGEFISLLDQDDLYTEAKLETVFMDLKDDSGIDVHISNRFKITKERTEKDFRAAKRKERALGFSILPNILISPGIMPVETVIRKSKIADVGGFDPTLRMSNDWDILVQLAKSKANFYYNRSYLAYYRLHENNTTYKHEGFVQERFKILDKFFNENAEPFLKFKNKAYAAAYLESANPRYKSRMFSEFRSDVHQILKLSPNVLTMKLLLRYLKSFFLRRGHDKKNL